jgi:hypothetical protein
MGDILASRAVGISCDCENEQQQSSYQGKEGITRSPRATS